MLELSRAQASTEETSGKDGGHGGHGGNVRDDSHCDVDDDDLSFGSQYSTSQEY